MSEHWPAHAIAIIGMAGRFPGADDLDGFWRLVRDGVDVLETFSDADLDQAGVPLALRSKPNYVRRGTALPQAEHFDAAFFALSPREAQILDPQQRIFLECAWQALEHAGHGAAAAEASVGVYAGASMNTYLINQLLRAPALLAAAGGYQVMLGNDKDFLCTRVSYKLDLRGPSMTIQTACSTSLVAVEAACRALQRGECGLALAGGVSVSFPQRGGYLFEEGMIFSPDGLCRPFDAQARGTRSGAGAGVVVLKRLAQALADGDTVHAVIRGVAINNDGAAKAGFTAPSVDGQIEVIAMAQALAQVEPRSVSYIEAHGTGTPLGDPIEVAALNTVFRASTADVGFCRLGSLKANLGHLDAAAGVAGLIKTVLALQHRTLPPLVNFTTANPQLDLARSPFAASAEAADWASDGQPRRAGVSSFGIGGTNAHAVLEEAPAATASQAPREPQLLLLSARTSTALEQATTRLADHLQAHPQLALANVAWTLQVGRRAFEHRRVVVASSAEQAVARLRRPQIAPVFSASHRGEPAPVAFLFSGQGSQHSGMGAELYRSEPVFRDAVDRCATLLQPALGRDLRTLMFLEEHRAALDETHLTQPALFVTEYALASLWMAWGVQPQSMLGHSIGEYVAAHLAGVMSLADALALVATRGRLMQAMPSGSMAAVHLGAAELERWLVDGIEIAAINTPTLCAVSGPTEAISALLVRLSAQGIDARRLHTSHAFHSAMMDAALAPFIAAFDQVALSPPKIPYLSNLTGTWITPEQATSPDYYARHLREAVRFDAGLRTLAADPALCLLEVGPGTALTALARSALGKDGGKRALASLTHPLEQRPQAEALLDAAGRLWLAGVTLDWHGLNAGASLHRVPLPTYPFERQRFGVDAEAAVEPPPAGHAAPAHRSAAALESGHADADLRDWFWLPSWQRSLPLAAWHGPTPPADGRWLVFRDDSAASRALVERFTQRGLDVVSVLAGERFEALSDSVYTIAPERREDVARLVAALKNDGPPLQAIAHWWTVVDAAGAAAAAPVPAMTASRRLGFYSLLHIAQEFAQAGWRAPVPVLVVSSDRCSVLGTERVRPDASLLIGPVYAMAQDIPFLRARNIDLASADWSVAHAAQLADGLIAEAARPDGEPVVAYRTGHRWLAGVVAAPLDSVEPSAVPIRAGGTYLVTGGTGGIGLAVAGHLARAAKARLVLTARTPLPDRAAWGALLADAGTPGALKARLQSVLELEALGSEVWVAAADVSDESQMRDVIAQTKTRFGTVHGVFHAAGILGSGSLSEKTMAGAEAVLRPKIEGTLVLDKLLAGAELDFFALFSSISTAAGGPGMIEYASANAFLDAFATSGMSRASRRVLALGWDTWRDVGFATAASDHVPAALMRTTIRPDEGIEALGRVLAASGLTHAYVARRSMTQLLNDAPALWQWLHDEAERPAAAPALPAPASTDRMAAAPGAGQALQRHESLLHAIWSELLGIGGIGLDDDFFELGGHSLLATRVLARIEEACGMRLALRDIFDAPTIRALAERMSTIAPAGGGAPLPSDDEREEIEF